MNIKKYIFLFISIPIFVIASNKFCNHSHTFFVPRQITTNSTFELGLNNYHWYENLIDNETFQCGFYATPFFQQSANEKKTARYFLRNQQKCLNFHEINENPENICSIWFGLIADVNNNFNALFSMAPRRRSYGSYFNFSFAKILGKDHLWFNIAFAAMRAEHKLNMCEQIDIKNGPLSNFAPATIDEFTSVIAALNNNEWKFGKFAPCTLKRTGIDDIQIKLGYNWFYSFKHDNHICPYIVGTIPTGKRQQSEFIFEPLVGSKHGSIGIGLNNQYLITTAETTFDFIWLLDIKYRYALSATQCRSFDLCNNGDWSRYLLIVPETQTLATQPGINLFSTAAKVTPGSTLDIWTAFHCICNNLNIEIGYDFWWRQKEKVRLKKCDIPSGFGIFDLAGIHLVPQSASQANISQSAIGNNKAPSDSDFVQLKADDLNLDSAAHPSTSSSTLFVAVGWHGDLKSHSTSLLGLGGQYEIAHNKSALSQWALWMKLGIII